MPNNTVSSRWGNDVFVHPLADVHPLAQIGDNTKIYQFTIITSAATIGSNCVIGSNCFIDGDIGNYCKIANGVQIWQGVELSDNCFVSHGVAFSNVSIPRTFRPIYREQYKRTFVDEGVTFEQNATIAAGITVGRNAIIGMGTVVLEDVPPKTMVHGNPAVVSLRSIKNKLLKSYGKRTEEPTLD